MKNFIQQMEKEFDEGCNADNISDPPSDKEWIKSFIRHQLKSFAEECIKLGEGLKREEIDHEECAECGSPAYGKSWYGHGDKTHESYGDMYYPAGSVAFCKEHQPLFRIGKVYDGEEIWKTTSDLPEFAEIRIGHIKKKNKQNVSFNQALTAYQEAIKKAIE